MYLVLQYVTAQRHKNFAVIFFLNFQAMDKILLLKERLEMTTLSICPGMLKDNVTLVNKTIVNSVYTQL
jgi:hypothetical protein